jgi:hypothetical protein
MHTKRPLIMIAILSQRASASSMRWVVSIIDEFLRCFSILKRLRREIGSTPVVGSSRNSTAGFARREIAQQSLRLLPTQLACLLVPELGQIQGLLDELTLEIYVLTAETLDSTDYVHVLVHFQVVPQQVVLGAKTHYVSLDLSI